MNILKSICKECAKKYKLRLCESGTQYGEICINCGKEKPLKIISLDTNRKVLNYYINN